MFLVLEKEYLFYITMLTVKNNVGYVLFRGGGKKKTVTASNSDVAKNDETKNDETKKKKTGSANDEGVKKKKAARKVKRLIIDSE